MKKTNENVTENQIITGNLEVIGKSFQFIINNDEPTDFTEQASVALIEWFKTNQNSKKYAEKYGIISGGWGIDITEVNSFNHVATAQDALTGGEVDVIYLTFANSLLNRFVYLDSEIRKRGTILLPINNTVQYVPFGFKYKTQRKTTARKTKTEKTENKTPKTNTKTNSTKTNTTATTEKTPTKKTKTATKTDTTKAEKVIK
jgi:hypothetical protein